jgi:DNA-binding beta-propeller fold protein YncE
MSNAIARLVALSAVGLALGAGAAPAQAGPSDPLFVFSPAPSSPPQIPLVPPPSGYLEGPCGVAVGSGGEFYVSDYYHDAVDVFSPSLGYLGQLKGVDPVDGPCGLALGAGGSLYVNDFHRRVVKYGPPLSFAPGPVLDEAHPTGVAVDPATNNVYVDDRTYIAVYDAAGAPVIDGGQPLKIGLGSLEDGYGLAISSHPGTAGRLYVADAATGTVKVYDPALDKEDPVATIAGPSGGGFVSLRDSALAVDRVSGNVYVADNLQPQYAEEPDAAIYVFGPSGAYLGRLKHDIVDALPPGLAVDNSATTTQGRVYVTSGNTIGASVYVYPPGAQTNAVIPSAAFGAADPLSVTSSQSATAAVPAALAEPRPKRPSAKMSQITQKGPLRLSATGRLSPRRLPRKETAPIAVAVGWKLATVDGSAVPQLKRLRIEINRHGRFDYAGLPTCPYGRIQTASSSRALAACRSALVGRGSFTADIALEGQEPYATQGGLLVFNGRRHGKPVLFGQIYSSHPFATSFVIVFTVQKLARGAYGTALSASLPKALSAWGNLTGIEMQLSRRYGYRGARHSYISAACPAPNGFGKALFPLARASFGFADGTKLDSTLPGTCEAR